MTTRNRELSQFGSFIYVENSTQEIGITTEALPYVGIGTTNPQYKLDVVGDTNVSGIVSASGYWLNGNELISPDLATWASSGSDIYRLNGNVGIGTTVPTEKLDVLGNITSSGDITSIGNINSSGIITCSGSINSGGNITSGGNIISSGIVTASRFISTVSTGTAPFEVSSLTLVTHLNADYLRGKIAPTGDIVGVSDTQILTNKTINLSSNTLTGTTAQFNTALSDNDFATIDGTETLTNKTLTSPTITSIVNSGTKTIPTGIGTFVITGSTETITSGMIVDGTIVNDDISASAAISISKLSSSTISGISLGSNLNNLTAGSYITYSSGTTYNGSSPITIGVAGTTINTANTLVARNGSGDFTAGTINCSNLTATFSVTAADINSTSDINLKTNIQTVENALDTVSQLRGVSFDWKENGKGSYGVIAQELEEILPELVKNGDVKSVNYNGIVGVLIEAIKDLKREIEELKK
jgi:hypothetical protein